MRLPSWYSYVMRKKRWTINQLQDAAKKSLSIRQVIGRLGLIEAGGNYVQIKRELVAERIDTSHFRGKLWNKGMKIPTRPLIAMADILVKSSTFQSHKLKKRLFTDGLKKPQCELCGWAKQSVDGRVPVELDHINGDRNDNRLENLRILCPNCHSLQATHRGRNIRCRGGEDGKRATLKMS
ncbi:MAG: hypothetical protein RLZZ416_569 [Candidatus Parcubacteria bacterium]